GLVLTTVSGFISTPGYFLLLILAASGRLIAQRFDEDRADWNALGLLPKKGQLSSVFTDDRECDSDLHPSVMHTFQLLADTHTADRKRIRLIRSYEKAAEKIYSRNG